MTEPTAGADPKLFRLQATEDPSTGDFILNGEKLWSSSAKHASFFLVCAVTDPKAGSPYGRQSIFIVDASNPGVKILRNLGVGFSELDHPDVPGKAGGDHAWVQYKDCRVPKSALLGPRGGGFLVQQTRLSGGRIHYGMRAVGMCKKALNATIVRVNSRFTQGEPLKDKQMVQKMIAEAWMEVEQLKLLVLRTAYKIDKYNDYTKVRMDISACKVLCSKVQESVARKAVQLHGGIGASWDLPFADTLLMGIVLGIADGPSEVHLQVVAKQLMRGYSGTDGPFPEYMKPNLKRAAGEKFKPILADAGIRLEISENEGGVVFTTSKL